jgi:hypothetical protein
MKHLQTYETLYFDLKLALRDALGKFFKDIYSDVPNLLLIPYEDLINCGLELSTKDENQKVLWCDVNITAIDPQSLELEIFTYNDKMPEVIEFIKSLIPPMRHIGFKGYIEKKNVKKFIKELTKDNFELFVSAKKYNL